MSRISAVLLCATLVTVLGVAASTADAAAKRLILSPRSGSTHSADPLSVRIKAGKHARTFRVQLNGKPIARYFSRPSADAVRSLRVSPTYGLRHGKNRLHVRVRRRHGRDRSKWSRFRVRRDGPLAAAGVDQRVAVGTPVYLDAGRSRSHQASPRAVRRSAGGDPRPDLRREWKVLDTPEGSPPGAGLKGSHSARPSLQPEVAGTYQVALTVTARDGAKDTDAIKLAVDPIPAVPVDTMTEASGSRPGIQVGTAPPYYADEGTADQKPWFQVVILDRKTLNPIANNPNRTYLCQRGSNGFCAEDQLRDDLAKLGDNALVIAANHMLDPSWEPPGYVPFTRIGARNYRAEDLPSNRIASFSAIGVPGTKPGEGTWHLDPAGGATGRIQSSLMRDNNGNYEYASSDRLDFNTQAPGSDAQQNVVQVGGKTFSSQLPAAGGGFQVVVVDPTTLQGTSSFFPTTDLCREDEIYAMRDALQRASDAPEDKLVFIASRGVPAVGRCTDSAHDVNFALYFLVNQVEKLGGTRNGIFHALDPGLSHGTSYTLIGRTHSSGGLGEEELADGTDSAGVALNAASVAGTMSRTGPNYSFEIEGSPTVGPQNTVTGRDPSIGVKELMRTAFQAPSAWPEQDPKVFPDAAERARKQAAIDWIGKQVLDPPGDVRGQFWTHASAGGQFDYSYWDGSSNSIYNRIGALAYNGPADFKPEDLVWAKAELRKEIGWLVETHRYMDKLATPFVQGQLASWSDVEDITRGVKEDVGVSNGDEVRTAERALFDGSREFAEAATGPAYTAVIAANTIYDVGLKLAAIGNDSAEDQFSSKASQVGKDLATRLEKGQALLQKQLPNVISADYGKLRTVGSCGSDDPKLTADCPFDRADWQITGDDQTNASKALSLGTSYWAYSALLPARYTLWSLPSWWKTSADGQFYGLAHFCFLASGCAPFDGLPASAQVAKPIYRNIPTYSHRVTQEGPNLTWTNHGEDWQIYALGYLTGSGTLSDRWEMHFPKQNGGSPPVTDALFKPPPAGLGVDPEQFFDRYFNPQPLNHYPERDTYTAWCADPTDDCH